MAVPAQQMDEFKAARKAAAEELSSRTLEKNPNRTYGSLLPPSELELMAHLFSPDVGQKAANIFNPEQLKRYQRAIEKISDKLKTYNIPPLDYDMARNHPEYQKRLDTWKTYQGLTGGFEESFPTIQPPMDQPLSGERVWGTPGPRNILDQRELDRHVRPTTPIGVKKNQRIAALGFDSRPENQLKVDQGDSRLSFEQKTALNPRTMTLRNYKFLGDQYGLEGDYLYIDPSDPSLGVAFRREGEENYQIINSPQITSTDVSRILMQEAPAIVGDIGLTLYASSKWSTPTGLSGTILGKGLKILGLSGASGLGAAGFDYIRLLAGYAEGAHDLDPGELIKEAGVTGAWAFGGTAVISASAAFITKAWRAVTGTDVPTEMWETIDDARQAAARAESSGTSAATPGLLYGDDITVKKINKQLSLLSEKFGEDLKHYNPTLAAEAGDQSASDLETVFLKYADDPKLRDAYQEIKNGNQEVIDRLYTLILEKIGPSTADIAAPTAATLGENLRLLAQRDIDLLESQMSQMFDKVTKQVSVDNIDASLAGETLLKRVANPEASSLPIFERTQTRLNELRYQYTKPFHDAWTKAINNELYKGLTTGAGKITPKFNQWRNARKADFEELFKSSEADEAVGDLYKMIPEGDTSTLQRLAGRADTGGQFENPKFTLNELNMARVRLNEFASNLPDNKGATKKLARKLEHAIEDQLNALVREGASLESGIPMGRKTDLNKWIEETKYGEDLRNAWMAQSDAVTLANSESIRTFVRQNRPEKVAEYIFSTSAKSNKNSVMTDLMTLLEKNGSDEILDIQNGMAAYIRREILDNPDGLNPYRLLKKYRRFIHDHEGTLKAVFGDKIGRRFGNIHDFEKLARQLDSTNDSILKLQARFGMAKQGDPNRKVANIIESILDTGITSKQSGEVFEHIQYLIEVTKGDKALQTQIAQVTKRWMLQNVIIKKQGGGVRLDADGLSDLLFKGFGPEEVVGPRLTFDSFFLPLLGKEGPELLENLKFLNNIVQREIGVEASPGITRALTAGEYGAGSALEGVQIIQKFLIAPLTQTGRRITAASKRQIENSRAFIGEMLLNKKLFTSTRKMAQGIESRQKFIRFLTSYNIARIRDMGNEMKNYDKTDKIDKTPARQSMDDYMKRFYNYFYEQEI